VLGGSGQGCQSSGHVAPVPVYASEAKSTAVAQAAAEHTVPAGSQAPEPADTQPVKINDGKIRIYVTDRPITEVISLMKAGSQGTGHSYGSGNGSVSGNSAGFRGNYSSIRRPCNKPPMRRQAPTITAVAPIRERWKSQATCLRIATFRIWSLPAIPPTPTTSWIFDARVASIRRSSCSED
jgi:hypothetical protein